MKRRSGQGRGRASEVNDSFDIDMDPTIPPDGAADNFGSEGSRDGNKQAGALQLPGSDT